MVAAPMGRLGFLQGVAVGIACALWVVPGAFLGPGLIAGFAVAFAVPFVAIGALFVVGARRAPSPAGLPRHAVAGLAGLACGALLLSPLALRFDLGLVSVSAPWALAVVAAAAQAHLLGLPAWRDRLLGLGLGWGLLPLDGGPVVGATLLAGALVLPTSRLAKAAALGFFGLWTQEWAGQPRDGAAALAVSLAVVAVATAATVVACRRAPAPTPGLATLTRAERGWWVLGALAAGTATLLLAVVPARPAALLLDTGTVATWTVGAAAVVAAWAVREPSRAAILGWSGAGLLVLYGFLSPAHAWLPALPGFLAPWLALGIRMAPASRAALVVLQYVALLPLLGPMADGAVSTNLVLAIGTVHLLLVWVTLPAGAWRVGVLAFGFAGAAVLAGGALVASVTGTWTVGRALLLAVGLAGMAAFACLAAMPRLKDARLRLPEWAPSPGPQ